MNSSNFAPRETEVQGTLGVGLSKTGKRYGVGHLKNVVVLIRITGGADTRVTVALRIEVPTTPYVYVTPFAAGETGSYPVIHANLPVGDYALLFPVYGEVQQLAITHAAGAAAQIPYCALLGDN
jgi:hypothetical protein